MRKNLWLIVIGILLLFFSEITHAATLTFTWVDNSTNEDGFQLKAKCAPASTFTNVGPVVAANVTTVQIVQQSNLLCAYHIVAFNTAGPSNPSNEVSYNSFTIPNTPGALQLQASAAVSQAKDAVAGLKKRAQEQQARVAAQQAGQAENRLSGALSLVLKAEAQVE